MSDTTSTESITRVVDGQTLPLAGTWVIDPSHSSLGFAVRHLMVSKVRGRFSDWQGTIKIADDLAASSVAISADAASIDTRDRQRDEHLRAGDFFDVATYPTVIFSSTGVEVRGTKAVVAGDLTIRGVTRPVEVDVEFGG